LKNSIIKKRAGRVAQEVKHLPSKCIGPKLKFKPQCHQKKKKKRKRRKEIPMHVTTSINLENMLSEIVQTQKYKYLMIPPI
jgi:hypothetical protein